VNTLRGLTSVRPQDLELMRSYAAGNVEVFRRVRIPTSLPFMFTGLKVATVLAMIGAVVGEYFGGALNAIGVLILSRSRVFQFNEAWAGVRSQPSSGSCCAGFHRHRNEDASQSRNRNVRKGER
jgi:NitT/TauT family transport system permease protein